MNIHPQSWLNLNELGSRIPPYSPTYDFPPPFIDKSHSEIANYPLHEGMLIQMKNGYGEIIPGWLRREDALKLYELSFFATEDVLELGSFHGLSTAIISRAITNSPTLKHIDSIDLDPSCTKATQNNLSSLGLLAHVTARSADAIVAVKDYATRNKQFGFIFIDHHHSYAPVFEVCQVLNLITAPGGFCLFHDFNDPRNSDPNNKDFGVYQAVMDGLDKKLFVFYGVYGCAGLYRRI